MNLQRSEAVLLAIDSGYSILSAGDTITMAALSAGQKLNMLSFWVDPEDGEFFSFSCYAVDHTSTSHSATWIIELADGRNLGIADLTFQNSGPLAHGLPYFVTEFCLPDPMVLSVTHFLKKLLA